jgi:hypothetical protein
MGNPFMAFAQQERKKIIAENPSLKSDIGKVGKMMGERWRKLSDAEKAKYKTMAGPTRKASKKSRKVDSEAPARKEKKTRKGTRKLSGYMKFVKAERGRVISENPKMKSDIMAVGKEMGKRWRAMSDAEKAKYN